MIPIFNIALSVLQFFIFWVLTDSIMFSKKGTFDAVHLRWFFVSMILVSGLEYATTLYDINGPGRHFPLEIRLPILLVQSALMIWSLYTGKKKSS